MDAEKIKAFKEKYGINEILRLDKPKESVKLIPKIINREQNIGLAYGEFCVPINQFSFKYFINKDFFLNSKQRINIWKNHCGLINYDHEKIGILLFISHPNDPVFVERYKESPNTLINLLLSLESDFFHSERILDSFLKQGLVNKQNYFSIYANYNYALNSTQVKNSKVYRS